MSLSVHPRIRGERRGGDRMRGHTLRFIPAYAGNAPVSGRTRWASVVHPRIRGERPLDRGESNHRHGSSPHTRGTHLARHPPGGHRRFIPAYAGNATTCLPERKAETVHPRIRGERHCRKRVRSMSIGSSPHTRGTRSIRAGASRSGRFIPAYAGNAERPLNGRCHFSVHPRIRGERPTSPPGRSPGIGSSPHTRGTHRLRLVGQGGQRFIPAYAGNASWTLASFTLTSVHPRIRGERTSNKLLIYRRKSKPSDSTKHSAC